MQCTHFSENYPCPPRYCPGGWKTATLLEAIWHISVRYRSEPKALGSSICYAVPNGIVRTRWHCSLIATSPTGCSNFLYSRATTDWNFPDGLQGISLIYGVWQPYKHVCTIMWRIFFPLFSYITAPVFGAGARTNDRAKLIVIEKTIAAGSLSAPDIQAQLR